MSFAPLHKTATSLGVYDEAYDSTAVPTIILFMAKSKAKPEQIREAGQIQLKALARMVRFMCGLF